MIYFMDKDTLILFITILTSGAVLSFAQFLITRWDNRKNISKKIDNYADEFKEYKAEQARTHILRFNDELHNNMIHSEEYFRQTLLDIDTYDRYCETHHEFANGLTVMASQYIKDEYKRIYLDRK